MNVKRPLCFFCVSLAAGILLCSFIGMSFFLIFVSVYVLFLIVFYNRLKRNILLMFLIFVFSAFGGYLYSNAEKTYYKTFDEYYGKPVDIEGYIDGDTETDDQSRTKFTLQTSKIRYQGTDYKVSGKLIVYINNTAKDTNNSIKYRSRVTVRSVIEKPKPAVNPGGFDYRRYLATIGVSGIVYLRDYSDIEITGLKGGGLFHKLGFYVKNKVLGIIEYSLGKNQAGLLSGMLIGYKDGLDEYAYNAFSKAGLTHIMVASGMNVAFIILPFTFLFKKLHVGNLTANIATIAVLILFVFVTGFSASVVRAVIMGIVILTGKIIMRETDIYTSISAAAIILLILNPFTIYDIGFMLSFGATLSLVMFYPKLKGFFDRKYIPGLVSDTLAATIAAQIGVVPITLYYFNNFSTVSIVSNLLVVPLVELITIIGFIMVFVGLVNIHMAVLIGYINNTFLSFVLFITEFTSKIPYASLKLPTPPMFLIILYYLFFIYLLIGRNFLKNKGWLKHFRLICLALLLLVLLVKGLVPKPLEVTFLDVGEGDCAFIKTSDGTKVLIDGGGRAANSKSKFDIGNSIVIPYILDRGTKKIDIVIATHGHSDHTEGLEAVLSQLNIGTLIIPDTKGESLNKIIDICTDRKIHIIKCRLGDRIELDEETAFDVMNPMYAQENTLSEQSLNESSLVLKLVYKKVSFLFTGDSGIESEQRMLEQRLDLAADLVKIGHHGSNGSSSADFISSVNPKYAVISVGKNNFGHPSQFVVDRLVEGGIRLLRTDERGAVIVKSYGRGLNIKTMLPE